MNWRTVLELLSKLLGLFAKPDPNPTPNPEPKPSPEPNLPNTLREVLGRLNDEREQRGKSALKANEKLNAAAQKHTEWMVKNETLDHVGENDSRPADRVRAEGYKWQAAGENIAMGYRTPESVMKGWMNSNGHRTNILGNYQEIGLGHAVNARKGWHYWTTVFATPSGSIRATTEVYVVESGILVSDDINL